jgi:RimJ/RimL family protein N-acetyltransferase
MWVYPTDGNDFAVRWVPRTFEGRPLRGHDVAVRERASHPFSVLIETPRLDLVAATAPCLLAEMEGPAALSRLIGARVGEEWPPPLFDADALEWALDQVRIDPRFEEWGMRYMVLRDSDAGGAEAVGVAGYKGPPDAENEVEIGYSVLPSYHRRGLASEAVAALVAHAFDLHGVNRIVAHTLPHLDASIGVLHRTGFTLEAELDGEDVVRFVREAW